MLKALSSRLNILRLRVSPERDTRNDDLLVEENGELKVMKSNGLELLDPVLSRDNFKDLRILTFELHGFRDTLPSYRESTLASIQQKLPMLHARATLNIQLELILRDRPSPPLA